MLDFATCTECGRCQSQCPAWNTGKPLSPKLVIMDLRDHWMAKAPYLLGEKTAEPLEGLDLETVKEEGHHVPESGFGRVPGHGPEQAARPLVGTAEQGGVIDPDVLWSCVTCGACVEQCPVDIEHIDHIVDMRRYQVMMESEFPAELSTLFKNLETKGNPWGQNASDRTNWINEVDFDVPVYGEDVDSFDGYEYLFWVGCAGAYDDKAKKTTKAVAELLAIAGVKYLVLGTGESCNGDSARRSGNEFLFQQLAPRPSRPWTGCSRVWRPSTARSWSPARTASTPSARNTGSSAPTTPCCTTPSCSTGWCATRSSSRSPPFLRTSPTTTRATWAGTTRCTRRRAS